MEIFAGSAAVDGAVEGDEAVGRLPVDGVPTGNSALPVWRTVKS